MKENKQAAWLSVFFPEGPNGTGYNTPGNSIHYVTTNFEEVYKFKKICASIPKESEIHYTVRFKQVENTTRDKSYVNKAKGENGALNALHNVINWLNKPLF